MRRDDLKMSQTKPPERRFEVFADFDGTITTRDTLDVIMKELADPSYFVLEEQWVRGEIGSRACLEKQVPLLRGGWPAMEEMLSEMQIDPTFPDFSLWLKEMAVPLRVVSDGIDRIILHMLERAGLMQNGLIEAVVSNCLQVQDDGRLSIEFPNSRAESGCWSGTCKCFALGKGAAEPAKSLCVVIGDGLSDRCWAKNADILFAKGRLLHYCRENQIPCHPFQDFRDVRAGLEKLFDL